ncbi:phosphoribosylanthranilate isomerase [Desulfocapsa sulfexigens DSM 10523]|uniref:N-(5'-phosphoribosyl)anthranilate isomerase n=1 Tax=Desulfocapsa sulfexigens (strain DSM 10523 / SB164P1) TaxID=1167006 RepID=M1NIQ6_DESSD|nr:phosphoribosylanthranilate isomerase [Desulfocapsa sulfexigens]AGF79444.1 phosphoribosylanthranilate isomerase [Desulfocapsa sulfexigens DSM 10523]
MHSRTRIKMCGMTREKDVEAGVNAGLDALGFIFYEKSPRNVYPDFVRAVISKVPPFVDCVGVFVDRDREEVQEIIEYCGLSHAQLHGKESPKYCERVERFTSPCHVIKAFRVGTNSKKEDFSPYDDLVHGYLLDTYEKGSVGGTGTSFDWSIIEALELQRPMILAGGLSPNNVENAIRNVSPFGVDVNSGVEVEPGIKDHELLKEFVRIVRQADAR